MNTATASHRIQALSALSLALLISGTSHGSNRSELASGERLPGGHESAILASQDCPGPKGHMLSFKLGASQSTPSCIGNDNPKAVSPAPIRLAKPLLGSPYNRTGESIRYSF